MACRQLALRVIGHKLLPIWCPSRRCISTWSTCIRAFVLWVQCFSGTAKPTHLELRREAGIVRPKQSDIWDGKEHHCQPLQTQTECPSNFASPASVSHHLALDYPTAEYLQPFPLSEMRPRNGILETLEYTRLRSSSNLRCEVEPVC